MAPNRDVTRIRPKRRCARPRGTNCCGMPFGRLCAALPGPWWVERGCRHRVVGGDGPHALQWRTDVVRHGRPADRAEGAPEHWIRPAIHVLPSSHPGKVLGADRRRPSLGPCGRFVSTIGTPVPGVGRPETESANTLVRRHGTVHPAGSPPRHARHATTKPATAEEPDARFGGRGRAPSRPLSCGQTYGEGHQTSGYTRQRGGWSDQSRWFRTAPCMRAVSSRTGSTVANSQPAVSRALSARIPSSGKPRSTGLSTAGGHATVRPGRPDTSAGRP